MTTRKQRAQRGTTRSKRKINLKIAIPRRALEELIELLAEGAVFEYACSLIGFYRAEVFEHLKADKPLAARLTRAVEDGNTADRYRLWLRLVCAGYQSRTAMGVAGINGVMLSNRKKADPEFALEALQAEQLGTDHLEDIAVRRAKNGSDVLLMFCLKARDRQRFSDAAPAVQVNNNTLAIDDGGKEARYEFGRRLAFALRYAAPPAATGGRGGNGSHPAGQKMDPDEGPAD